MGYIKSIHGIHWGWGEIVITRDNLEISLRIAE